MIMDTVLVSPSALSHKSIELPSQVDQFVGEFAFLSNFYKSTVYVNGEAYPTVEHAFQAAKTDDSSTKKIIKNAKNPWEAKKLGKSVQLPVDWDKNKVSVMRELVQEKFSNPFLRHLLKMTKGATLTHGNPWGDRFWGTYKGEGQNMLGKILEEIRERILSEDGE